MDKAEAQSIINDIEQNDELGNPDEEYDAVMEELSEMDEDEGEMCDDEEEDSEGESVTSITQIVNIVKQPVRVTVDVGADVGAKGEVKPFAKASIERHLDFDGWELDEVYNIIEEDFTALFDKVQTEIMNAKQKMNKSRSDFQ